MGRDTIASPGGCQRPNWGPLAAHRWLLLLLLPEVSYPGLRLRPRTHARVGWGGSLRKGSIDFLMKSIDPFRKVSLLPPVSAATAMAILRPFIPQVGCCYGKSMRRVTWQEKRPRPSLA